MPELPEVETICQGIRPFVEHHCIFAVDVRDARLRWPVESDLPELLTRKSPQSVSRRGKYIVLMFPHGALLVHLGMSGSLRVIAGKDRVSMRKHDHVIIQFANHELRYHDPRRFGCLLWTPQPVEQHPLISRLGPEPLTADFSGGYLYQQAKSRRVAIKSLIMNSQIVVGVGNIYACEALFKAGIDPLRAAHSISEQCLFALVAAIKDVLQKAIHAGGTTLRDFVNGFDQPGYFKQQLMVYGRGGKACLQCGESLSEIRLQQRTTVYCHQCQS